MSDIRQTDDGDIYLENGDIVLIRGVDEVKQALRQRLRTFFGEWFLDRSVGVPYHGVILEKQPIPAVVDDLLKAEILATPGVLELNQFELDLSPSRVLTLTFQVRSQEGEVLFSEVIP